MNFDRILKNVSRHIDLTKVESDFFVSIIRKKTIKRRAFVLKAGEICGATTFVNSGCLRSYYEDELGIHIIQFAIESWWIGDLKSYVHSIPARLSVDALTDSEIFQIPKSKLEVLYDKVPKFERFFRIQMENALISHQERILQSLTMTSETRYENFVRTYPDFHRQIPLKDIANYLGITPEYLSAIRKKNKGPFLKVY